MILQTLQLLAFHHTTICLQCFYTVGWASGTASGL